MLDFIKINDDVKIANKFDEEKENILQIKSLEEKYQKIYDEVLTISKVINF